MKVIPLKIFEKSPRSCVRVIHRDFRIFARDVRRFNAPLKSNGVTSLDSFYFFSLDLLGQKLDDLKARVERSNELPELNRSILESSEYLKTGIQELDSSLAYEGLLKQQRVKQLGSLQHRITVINTTIRQLYERKSRFQKELGKLQKKSGLTPYGLGIRSGVDTSHVYKLLKGEKRHPTRETLERLCKGLRDHSYNKVRKKETDGLMKSAGFRPNNA